MNSPATQVELRHRDAGTLGELLRVAVPLIISSGTNAMMYIIDRIFLSWDSVDSMAAALPAGVLYWNLASLFLGTVGYCNAFVGQYEGAGERHRIGPVLWQGIYLSLFATALIMLGVVPFASDIFRWFDHDPAIQALELRYFNASCWCIGPMLLATTLSCFYSGRGRTTVIMCVDIVGCLVNVVLDYLLIFGKAGFPRWGIEGAAIATAIAFVSIALMYVVILAVTERNGEYSLFSGWRLDRKLFGRLLRFGFPSGIQQFLDIACWTIFVQLVGRLGRIELSATSLLFNLNSLSFIPLIGMGTAVMALTGQRIGEGRPQLAVRTTWMAIGLASGYVAFAVFVYLFLPELILRPYGLTEHGGAVEEAVIYLLRFVAVYSLFDAMVVVFSATIRGAGDTRFSLMFSVGTGIVVLVIPTYIASGYGPAGFHAAWYAVTAFVTVLGLGFMARFQQGRWKTMRVIEHTAAEVEATPADDPQPEDPVAQVAGASS